MKLTNIVFIDLFYYV